MLLKSSLEKLIALRNHFPKLDNKGSLLIPDCLKIKDVEFAKYRHLSVNWEIKPVTGNDLPDEFSPKAVKLIDLFRRKTIDIDYEIMLIFDYETGELIYCFVNDYGESNKILGNVDENVFVGKHIASIHNHPHGFNSPPSEKNFQILELEFEEYELISSKNELWILESKDILQGNEIRNIKTDIHRLYIFAENNVDNENVGEKDMDRINELYGELLLNYISSIKFNVHLERIVLK